jgi:hypothetical protein
VRSRTRTLFVAAVGQFPDHDASVAAHRPRSGPDQQFAAGDLLCVLPFRGQ